MDPVKRPLPSVLGVKLSSDLRGRIAKAAAAEGVSDSAWLRLRALDALGLESAVDAASGPRPRIPPEEQAVLAGALRDLGALYEPLSRSTVNADEIKAGLDRIRGAVMPIVIGLNARSA
ncbi:hypothetical protein [Methylobacterium brachythecii]|uniref:hypothetical protein n=1 Tax=Methylobacterium brachythecii TaxID=1176177 RepID=UPI001FE4BF60|nr:hypothetical protein [Methylobacterium brachythecii]